VSRCPIFNALITAKIPLIGGFLAFVVTITAIAVAAALIQIYLQNAK
jgi:hypothetical protein